MAKGYTKHQKSQIKRSAATGGAIGGAYAGAKTAASLAGFNSRVPAGSPNMKFTGGQIGAASAVRGVKGSLKGAAALGGGVAATNALSNRKRRKGYLIKKNDDKSAFGVEH